MPKVQWNSEGAEKIVASWEQITGKVRQGKDAAKDYTRAQQELGRIAQTTLRQNETGQERYNRKIAEATKLYQAGSLSVTEYRRVHQRLTEEQLRTEAAGRKVAAANKNTFSQQAIANLGRYAAGFVGIGAAVSVVSSVLRGVQQDAQAAADAIKNTLDEFGELQQLGGPKTFAANTQWAMGLVERGAIPKEQLGEAARVSFALTSAGYTPAEKEMLAGAAEAKFVGVPKLAELGGSLRKYQKTFGAAETGDLRGVLRKGVVASEVAQSDLTTILTSATRFGGEAQRAGLSDEEAMAAFLAIEGQAPTAEIASTRMRSFMTQISKRGLAKGTFTDTLTNIQAAIEAGKTPFAVLGETEAVAGFGDIMAQREFVRQKTADLQRAQRTDVLGERISSLRRDPYFGPALTRQRAEGRLAVGQIRRESAAENLFGAIVAERQEYLEAQGHPIAAQLYKGMAAADEMAGARGPYIRGAAAGAIPGVSAETSARATEYLERIAKGTDEQIGELQQIRNRQDELARQGVNYGRQE